MNAPSGGLGGIAVLSRNLWRGLARRGDVELLAVVAAGELAPELVALIAEAPAASVVALGGRSARASEGSGSRRLLRRFIENELPVPNRLRSVPIDVLHRLDHTAPPRRAPFASVTTICDSIAFDEPPRGTSLRHRVLLKCEQRMLALSHRADAVAAISETTARRLVQHVPSLAGRVDVVFIGTELPALAPQATAADSEPYFLHVGALVERKNPGGLLHAFAQFIARNGAVAHLVCAGPYRTAPAVAARIHVLARQLNIDSLVRIPDNVSDAALAELYRGCQALVYPSFDEGFGLPLVEALATGTPCVSSDISACREAAGTLGIYVDPHSPDSIAAGMERARDPAHRRRIAEGGPVWAQQFSIARMAENYVQIYGQAVARRQLANASVRRGLDAPA